MNPNTGALNPLHTSFSRAFYLLINTSLHCTLCLALRSVSRETKIFEMFAEFLANLEVLNPRCF